MERIYYQEMQTPIGPMLLAVWNQQTVYANYGMRADLLADIRQRFTRYLGELECIEDTTVTAQLNEAVQHYFAGTDALSIDMHFLGTPFQQQVWQALCTIPFGETCTYKSIAEQINNVRAVRAVGQAINRNPISILVPCHRVIGTNGTLTGYNGGLEKKSFLLGFEKSHEITIPSIS